MSDRDHNNRIQPISGEPVEVDGVYANEWGREEELKRGQVFPADPMLGTTGWKLVEYDFDNHHDGKTDMRLTPKDDDDDPEAHMQHPRRHDRHKGTEQQDNQ
ncbi:transposase [Paenibacillus protaetiae]|uniref:Transposase n=1 Tax=Paenibacillus protaetiae TaxID=2509456 RepID=A0A4P6F256_9BACL|nr:transposase [Paenibacillus protaetiae]QAY67147.1 transposase [Paenibacillus protaetiae]